MRKICAALAALMVTCALLPALAASPAEPEAIPLEQLTWEINEDGGITILRYTGKDVPDLVVPGTIEGRQVTRIGDGAFRGEKKSGTDSYERNDIKSVVIPEGVEILGESAFEDNTGLVSVQLPNSLVRIGKSAFSWCRSIKEVSLPERLYSIGSSAFYDCTSLASIAIPEGTQEIGVSAFSGCTALRRLQLAGTVRSIETNTFYECTALVDVVIPEGVENIGWLSFSGCTHLSTVWIPRSIRSIHTQAFLADLELEDVHYAGTEQELRDTGIAEGVFRSADIHYESVYTPEPTPTPEPSATPDPNATLTPTPTPAPTASSPITPEYLFSWTSNGEDTALITHFDYQQAAEDDISVESIYVPGSIGGKTVTAIGDSVFNATRLTAGNPATTSIWLPDSVLDIGRASLAGNTLLEQVHLPSRLERMGEEALAGCTSLRTLRIPNSVRDIGKGALSACASLEDISLPDALVGVPPSLFEDCAALGSVRVPEGASQIGENAMRGCTALRSVYIPESVLAIGEGALRGCPDLQTIYYEGSASQFDAIQGVEDGRIEGMMPDAKVLFNSQMPTEPDATATPVPSQGPAPTPTPAPSDPDATATPEITPHPTQSAAPTAEQPSPTPAPTSTPSASQPPSPTPAASPTPRPSPVPVLLPDGISIEDKSPLLLEQLGDVVYAYGFVAGPADKALTVSQLKEQLWTASSISIRVLDPDGQAKTDDEIVGTGDVLWVGRGELTFLRAIMVIQGDVTGSGIMSLSQLVNMAGAFRGERPLSGAYLEAASFTRSGTVTLNDLVRESQLFHSSAS